MDIDTQDNRKMKQFKYRDYSSSYYERNKEIISEKRAIYYIENTDEIINRTKIHSRLRYYKKKGLLNGLDDNTCKLIAIYMNEHDIGIKNIDDVKNIFIPVA